MTNGRIEASIPETTAVMIVGLSKFTFYVDTSYWQYIIAYFCAILTALGQNFFLVGPNLLGWHRSYCSVLNLILSLQNRADTLF